jgi:CheY-like chemotaxis protein
MARILLVEDDADQRMIRRLVLEKYNYAVSEADSPAEALRSLSTETPDCILMDLRLPEAEDGLALIRDIRIHAPRTPLLVLSGYLEDLRSAPEAASVNAMLQKPVRTEHLLRAISRLLLCLLLLVGMGRLQAQSRTFPFTVARPAEVVAELLLSAPGADWAQPGKEAPLAKITLDGSQVQHTFVTGARPYRLFLGPLPAGQHQIQVEVEPKYSAASSPLAIGEARFEEVHAGEPGYEVLAHAPILPARLNTVGRFTDIPLLMYCTRGEDSAGRWLEYTVIFTNEDGGTSTRDLMARWGRTTDIEYIYRVWLTAQGGIAKTLIQTRDHRDVPYDGPRQGLHPILMPVTDNNMVEPAARNASPIVHQMAPILTDLSSGSRELVMDANPFTYEISAKELLRENKLRPFGTFDGEKISDPRNYLIVELKVNSALAGLQVLIQRKGSPKWQGSAVGLGRDHIERGGWVRTTLELPPGTKPDDIDQIGVQCLSQRDLTRQPVAKNGKCSVQGFGKVFFLGPDYRPQASIPIPLNNIQLDVGEMVTAPVR